MAMAQTGKQSMRGQACLPRVRARLVVGLKAAFMGALLGALTGGLTGCGGGKPQEPASQALEAAQRVPLAVILADGASGFTCAPGALVCVQVESTASTVQARVPVTFGQPFRAGDLAPGTPLQAQDSTGGVPLQVDGVSTREDGSVRLALLSAELSNLQPGEKRLLHVFAGNPPASAAAATAYTVPTEGLAVQATVYKPQRSQVVFGNRNGHTPGTPFLEGEVITLNLTLGEVTETYALTVSGNQVGGAFTSLTQIAWAFHNQINARANGLFKAIKEGTSYETLDLITREPGRGAFTVSVQTQSAAPIRVDAIKAFAAPQLYQATAAEQRAALQAALSQNLKPHLVGPVAREHTLVLPLRNAQGQAHPQLTARVHTRLLQGGARVRHDLVMENAWAYNPEPGNLVYSLQARLGQQLVLDQPAFTHYHHARWHRVLWQGAEAQAVVRHHMPYTMASGVIWQYDLDLKISERTLAEEATRLAAANTGLMQPGFLAAYFPTTGGRWEIGPYPRWTALYLVTQDARARASMLTHADLVGGVPIHYRDAVTDQPLDLDRHPGVTVLIGSSAPADALPAITDHSTLWSPDIAHQGSFTFVPYVLTGDVYHLDELMFWAAWNMNGYNPGYRGQGLGLLHPEQVRGQAWALRALGETARALPDAHPMKAYFEKRLANNLAWYNDTYRAGGQVSPLGALVNPYQSDTIGPWQNDFFGLVVAQLVQDGYSQARPIFHWVSQFNVGRFMQEQDAGYCVAKAPAYYVTISKTVNGSKVPIDNWREVFQTNWPGVVCDASLPLDPSSYPGSSLGYAANARAMLAAAANAGHPDALAVYRMWVGRTPGIDGAFLNDPTWAVAPLRH